MASALLHGAAMARLSMKLEAAREDVLSPLARAGQVSIAGLQESGLSSAERKFVRKWVSGVMSGRSCMFALLSSRSDRQAESGFLGAGADHKLLFSLGGLSKGKATAADRENGQGLGLSLLAASLNMPPAVQMQCNSGYLFESCFALSPATVLRQAVNLIRGKALQQNLDSLSTDQLNLALRQLQVQFLFDAAALGDAKADKPDKTGYPHHLAHFGSPPAVASTSGDFESEKENVGANSANSKAMQQQQQQQPSHELLLQERELHWQVLLEVVRIHVRDVNGHVDADEPADEEEARAQANQQELLRHLRTPLDEVQRDALKTSAAELEEANRLLKPYLQRLAALKTRLSTQLADMEENEAYYTLGVSEASTSAEIKKAYHALSRKCHPDKGGDKLEFQRLQAAYQEVLKRRKALDEKKKKQQPGGESSKSPKGSPDRSASSAKRQKKYNLGGEEDFDSEELEEALNKDATTTAASGEEEGPDRHGADAAKAGRRGREHASAKTTSAEAPDDLDDGPSNDARDSQSGDVADTGSDDDTDTAEEDVNSRGLSDSSEDEEPRREKSERVRATKDRARRTASPTPPKENAPAAADAFPRESFSESSAGATSDRKERPSPFPPASPKTSRELPADSANAEQEAQVILQELGASMLVIKQSADRCTHLAQLSLYWQGLLDRAAGLVEPAAGETGAPSTEGMFKRCHTLPPRQSLAALIDLVFDGCCADGRNDVGLCATVDADACALRHIVAPLESLCSGLQTIASVAMKLPSVGTLYGMATAKDDQFIASVEKCMQSGLDAMRCSIALASVDAQLQTCLTRLQTSPEFRELRYGTREPTATFGGDNSSRKPAAGAKSKAAVKSKRLQKRLRNQLNAKFERRQQRATEKARSRLIAAERRKAVRKADREARRSTRRTEKKVERLLVLQAAKRIEKRRARRQLRREVRQQMREESERKAREEAATARVARAVADRHARVALRAAGLPEVPSIDLLERVSAQARKKAGGANFHSADAIPLPPPVPPRVRVTQPPVSSDQPPLPPKPAPSAAAGLSSSFLEGFDMRTVYGINRQFNDSADSVSSSSSSDASAIEDDGPAEDGSDSDDNVDDIMKRYQAYRDAYDESCRLADDAADGVAKDSSNTDDVLRRYQAYRATCRDAPSPRPPSSSSSSSSWTFRPYDVPAEDEGAHAQPDVPRFRSTSDSGDSYDSATFASDVAEIDALLSSIDGNGDGDNRQPRTMYEDPYNSRIRYGDSADMDFMYSTRNSYRRFGQQSDASRQADALDDSTCSGSSSSSSSGSGSSDDSDSDLSDTWGLDDISVSDSEASSSSDSSIDSAGLFEQDEQDDEDVDDGDVFLDSNFNSIFDNLSDSDGDSSNGSNDSDDASTDDIGGGSRPDESRSGASILVDMVTTAFRSAGASMNVAAEQVVGAACAASSVYRQAQTIVRRAETDLLAESQAAARSMAASEAEEDELCAEDKAELKEMKRKQGEEESKAQAQAAAEDAATEAVRRAREDKEDEKAVDAELDSAGVKDGMQRQTLRTSKLNSRKTDRELGELKDKIQLLQVKLRMQHVKNLKAANGEARRLQNRLQAQFLAHCEVLPQPVATPAPAAKVAKDHNACISDLQQELQKLRRALHAHGGVGDSAASSVAYAAQAPVPVSPVQAMLTLLADFIDTSILDLRAEFSSGMSGPVAFGCVLRHMGWLLALSPAVVSAGKNNSGASETSQAEDLTQLALPPDGRSKALWLTALVAPHSLKSLVSELQPKLDFVDTLGSALSTEASNVFGQACIVFSESFCSRINNGVVAARSAVTR